MGNLSPFVCHTQKSIICSSPAACCLSLSLSLCCCVRTHLLSACFFALSLSPPPAACPRTIIIAAVFFFIISFSVCSSCFSFRVLQFALFVVFVFLPPCCLFQVQPTFVFVVPENAFHTLSRGTHLNSPTDNHPADEETICFPRRPASIFSWKQL